MFVQDNLEDIEVVTGANFPNPNFLSMFIGLFVCPIVLFSIGGPAQNILWQTGLVWALLTIVTTLLPLGTGSRLMKLRSKSGIGTSPSIRTNFSQGS